MSQSGEKTDTTTDTNISNEQFATESVYDQHIYACQTWISICAAALRSGNVVRPGRRSLGVWRIAFGVLVGNVMFGILAGIIYASAAMRRHASVMTRALSISLAKGGSPTEEQKQKFKSDLVSTFGNAESAWDAYRDHLIEHGFLPSPK